MRTKSILYVLLLTLCSCATYVAEKDHVMADNIRISEESVQVADRDISTLIAPYKNKLDSEMNEVIAITEVDLIKASPESTMGNWFADILFSESVLLDDRVSFAMQNRGGLRIGSISKGEITKGKIFELMPFDNFLVIMETDGATMKEFIIHTAEDSGWPSSKELKIEMQDSIVTSILVNEEEIDPSRTYYYAIPDYIANGGSNADMLKEEKRENTGIMIRDVVINHLRKNHKNGSIISAKLDGRFKKRKSK